MRVGSIVRLSRPLAEEHRYKGAIGIVECIEDITWGISGCCKVRIEDPYNKYTHYTFTCLKSRFDILEE